jgi:hypothetical protein
MSDSHIMTAPLVVVPGWTNTFPYMWRRTMKCLCISGITILPAYA